MVSSIYAKYFWNSTVGGWSLRPPSQVIDLPLYWGFLLAVAVDFAEVSSTSIGEGITSIGLKNEKETYFRLYVYV